MNPATPDKRLLAESDAVLFVIAEIGGTWWPVAVPRVRVPRLVMHAREDAGVPFDGGRRMAAGIRARGS